MSRSCIIDSEFTSKAFCSACKIFKILKFLTFFKRNNRVDEGQHKFSIYTFPTLLPYFRTENFTA